MANPCRPECKTIRHATIGVDFVVGCIECPIPPIFDPNTVRTSGPGKYFKYRDKLRKHGLLA